MLCHERLAGGVYGRLNGRLSRADSADGVRSVERLERDGDAGRCHGLTDWVGDERGEGAERIKRVAADAVGRVIGSSIEKALDDAIGKSGKLPKKLEEIVLAKFEASFVRALETEAANLGHQAAKDHVARIYAEQITPTFVEDLAVKAVATEPA